MTDKVKDISSRIEKLKNRVAYLQKVAPNLNEDDVKELNILQQDLMKLRDDSIETFAEEGVAKTKIAESFNLSKARISQILKKKKLN